MMNEERRAQLASFTVADLRNAIARYNWLVVEMIISGEREKEVAYEQVRADLLTEFRRRFS